MMLYARMSRTIRNVILGVVGAAFAALLFYAMASVLSVVFWSHAPENIRISVIEKTNRLPVGGE